jgi:hypothetical protein
VPEILPPDQARPAPLAASKHFFAGPGTDAARRSIAGRACSVAVGVGWVERSETHRTPGRGDGLSSQFLARRGTNWRNLQINDMQNQWYTGEVEVYRIL